MRLSRRGFVLGGTAVLAGCDGISSAAARALSGGIPESFARPDGDALDPDFFFLQRVSFGPAPGDLDRYRKDRKAYVEEQLHPERVSDAGAELLMRRLESLHFAAGDLFEFKRRVATEEISRAAVLRAVYSRRQLYEVLVEFWSDHLNIFHGKGACAWLKTADDRDVVRAHALGRFCDLIRASALSPAMLHYLDGNGNDKGKPNENYARELLELHTLGVRGGYTQKDVMEAARCLTGWTVRSVHQFNKGRVEFHPERHDDGPKTVLGRKIPSGQGPGDVDSLVNIVAEHPSTASFIAGKLCRRFLSDEPPSEAVRSVAARFAETGGDLRETAREVVSRIEPGPLRFKRPFRFVVSALRGLGATTQARQEIQRYLERMGQAPFEHPTPDGYPDKTEPWLGTLLWRWNFALALAKGRIHDAKPGIPLDDPAAIFGHLAGRRPSETERRALSRVSDPGEALALVLAGPAFQWY